MSAADDRAFATRLHRELPTWQREGIIDAPGAEAIRARHPADALAHHDRAAIAVYVLGALLVGGGVISFVAWNWASMPDALKLTMIGSAMVAAHGGGWWLWKGAGTSPRLGHALTLLGTLIFGANIGLVAQIFHVSSTPWHGVAAWAFGAAVAAVAYRSAPTGVLATLVATSAANLAIGGEQTMDVALAPYVVAVVAAACAWAARSRAIAAFGAVAFGQTLAFAAGIGSDGPEVALLAYVAVTAICLAAPVAFAPRLQTVGRRLGLAAFAALMFFFGFHEISGEVHLLELDRVPWLLLVAPPALFAAGSVFVALRRGNFEQHLTTWLALTGLLIFTCALVVQPTELFGAIAANLALAAVSIASVRASLSSLRRLAFWGGTVGIGSLVAARFFEFQTELWLKAIVFIVCGLAVIAVGLVFERRLKEGNHVASQVA